ncbi:tetratricopeptide repeat protein [Methanofollis formosanus]|uniref:Tetratricopeptide repeat protein n=1 Tax=Methanofollis formosanus TaxID=299308 RepID=A0A8G1A1A6_9EURY|nr:tetratricopeptide repeat protein [Methanofollis formosanus]QYZ78267.1 tetratricopeptide repeat protein [Methanofollis formosanus]
MKVKWVVILALLLVGTAFFLSDRIAEDPEYLNKHVAGTGATVAGVFLSSGHAEPALDCIEFFAAADPDNPDLLWVKGDALSAAGRYEEAVVCYDTVLLNDPDDPRMLVGKAEALSMAGELEEALEACEQALASEPEAMAALDKAGYLNLRLGRYLEAADYYDTITEARPENAAAWIRRGDAFLYISIRQEEELKETYRTLGTPGARTAVAPLNVDPYMEAMECYNHAIALDPKTAPLLAARLVARSEITMKTCEEILENLGK